MSQSEEEMLADIFYEDFFCRLVALEYNSRRGFFKKKINSLQVLSILRDGEEPKGISAAEAKAIAKAFCKGAMKVCPYIEKS